MTLNERHAGKKRYCLVFQYDDSNCTREAYGFDSYEEAFQALLDDFRGDNREVTDEELKSWLDEIECMDGSWSDNGKVWEIITLYEK